MKHETYEEVLARAAAVDLRVRTSHQWRAVMGGLLRCSSLGMEVALGADGFWKVLRYPDGRGSLPVVVVVGCPTQDAAQTAAVVAAKLDGEPDPGVRLQGVGLHTSKLAGDVRRGDVLVWNYGYRSEVLNVRDASRCFVELTTRQKNGGEFTRRLRKDRRVAWAPSESRPA